MSGSKRVMSWLLIALVSYATVAGAMFLLQRSLLYPGARVAPILTEAGFPGLTEVSTRPESGIELTHWYHPPADDKAPVIVMFHGNAGHIGDRVPKMRPFIEAGFGLFLTGYRGYGGNPGRPSEDGLSADARTVLDWLVREGIPSERIVLYGESLGSAVAVKMASERRMAGLVLEAPPSSIVDVAQSHYWYLPVRLLLLDRWNSRARIAQIGTPLLILHGAQDRIVPIRFGRRLFEAATEPKTMMEVPAGNHVDLLEFPDVVRKVRDFALSQAARS